MDLPTLDFLSYLYHATEGDDDWKDMLEMGRKLGYHDSVTRLVVDQLCQDSLLWWSSNGQVKISDQGVAKILGYEFKEKMEQSSSPVNLHINGNVSNTQFQINSSSGSQNQVFDEISNEDLISLIIKIDESLNELRICDLDKKSLKEDLSEIKAQLNNVTNKDILKNKLRSVIKILRTSSDVTSVASFVFQLLPLIGL